MTVVQDLNRYSEVEFAKLQQQVQDLAASASNFGVLIAVVAIGFGALLTAVVIFFALRTEKASIAAVRDELRAGRAEIEQGVADAKKASQEISRLLNEIEGHRSKAQESSSEIELNVEAVEKIVKKFSLRVEEDRTSDLSSEESKVLADAATSLDHKPLRDLTGDEFRILITEAKNKEDWHRVRDLASAYVFNFQDEAGVAESLADRIYALDRLNLKSEAMREAESFIDRFKDDTNTRKLLNRVYYNYGVALGKSDRKDKAALAYNKVISDLEANPNSRSAQIYGARSLCNRANFFIDTQQFELARKDIEAVLAMDGLDLKDFLQEPAVRTRLTFHRLAKVLGDEQEAIPYLEAIIEKHKSADDVKVQNAVGTARKQLARARSAVKSQTNGTQTLDSNANVKKVEPNKRVKERRTKPPRSDTKEP